MTIVRHQRTEFGAKIRLRVAGESDLAERYAPNMGAGGMFVRDDRPPPVGTRILIEFILPDDSTLCRIEGKVVRAKPAVTPGEPTAGMGIEFVQLDERARLLADYRVPRPADIEPPRIDDELSAVGGEDVLGIDLGTTNSCVAIVENGTPRVIASAAGYDTVPSVVFIAQVDGKRKVLTGHKAVERMILEPQRAIYGAKRFIGRPFESRELSTYGHFFHYELCEGARGRAAVRIDDHVYPLEWVSGCVLAHLRHLAHKALGRAVTKAVITVPAYFGETQRQAVREAGKLAGLDIQRVVNEPTAAAVAFGYGRGYKKTLMVYDLGGGTFDVSIMRLEGDRMRVLSTDGDPFLGGSDFDDRITELLLSNLERAHGLNLRRDKTAVQRVRFAAELAKKQLSQAKMARIDVPYLATGPDGPIHLTTTLELDQFESLTDDLVMRTLDIVESALQAAKLRSTDIDEIIMVGGQSRSPHVAERLFERFGKRPARTVHPDHAVALGAAVVGAAAYVKPEAEGLSLVDVLPASLRLGRPGGTTQQVLARGTALPASARVEIDVSETVEPPSAASGHGGRGGPRNEYLAVLYRGENDARSDNELIGSVKLPATFALSITKTKAPLTLTIDNEGLLHVVLEHPLTQEQQSLSVDIKPPGENDQEIMLIDDADIVSLV